MKKHETKSRFSGEGKPALPLTGSLLIRRNTVLVRRKRLNKGEAVCPPQKSRFLKFKSRDPFQMYSVRKTDVSNSATSGEAIAKKHRVFKTSFRHGHDE